MTSGTATLRHDGAIAWLTLERVAKRNAIDAAMLDALEAGLDEVEARSAPPFSHHGAASGGVRALVLAGAGEHFCAGADLGTLAAGPEGVVRAFVRHIQGLANRLEALPVPSIAMLQGYTLGGGLELALACDLRIAAEDARLGLPETTWGAFPAAGATRRLPRLVGPGRARDLLLTGRMVSGQEAERIGLVERAVPRPRLEDEVRGLAEAIAANPPEGIRELRALLAPPAAEAAAWSERELERLLAVLASASCQAGLRALLARRREGVG